jgi:hypothetical protein
MVGREWHPAPNRRAWIQIVDNPRRGVQEVVYRHMFREGVDAKIDELHGPASLLWSPNSEWLAVNHRDYGELHDFLLFRDERGRLAEMPDPLGPVEALWNRLEPRPMRRLAIQAVRWTPDSEQMLVLVTGELDSEGARAPAIVRHAVWLDPSAGVVTLAETPADLAARPSPFGRN